MAQRHPDRTPLAPPTGPGPTAGDALAGYLGEQAAEFLRGLRLRTDDEAAGDRLLRGSARRISAVLHVYEPLVDPVWAESLRAELGWLVGTVCREYRYAAHLVRLRSALHRLASGDAATAVPAQQGAAAAGRGAAASGAAASGPGRGPLAVGAARAGALLERQLTLARTRAHSATLQAFGSARFHALADEVALLGSEPPLTSIASGSAPSVLASLADRARRRLAEAADALPLPAGGFPYSGPALRAALSDTPAEDAQDAPWHRARALLRVTRYAFELAGASGGEADARLYGAERALHRHREAADAAAAAASAARTPRITPATAYALGVLHADQRTEVEAARHAFGRHWQGAVPL